MAREKFYSCCFYTKIKHPIYAKHTTCESSEMFSLSLALKKGLFALIFPQRGENTVNCWQIENVQLRREIMQSVFSVHRKGRNCEGAEQLLLQIDNAEKSSWFKDRDFRKEQFTVCRKLILIRIGYVGVLLGMRGLIR